MKKLTLPLFVLLAVLFTASCHKKSENMLPEVDAGTDVTIKLNVDSTMLTGTASDKDGQVVSYLWRKLSGEGEPFIATPADASTWVKNLLEGRYVFQLLAKDNSGAVATDTVVVVVLPADTFVVSAQPANNPTEVHLFGNSNGINQSDPMAPEIAGGAGTYLGDPVNIRALLKFDLSDIPANAKIESAKLTLYSNPTPLNGQDGNPNYGTDNALLIQRVTDTWDYTNVNWLNQPAGTSDGQLEVPHTDEPILDLVDLDVTNLIGAMVVNGNNGFLIKLKTEQIYTWRIFCSSKYSDASKHPKLEVVYSKND